MINFDQEQRFGSMALTLLILRRISAGIILLILVSFSGTINKYFFDSLVGIINITGTSQIFAGYIVPKATADIKLIVYLIAFLIIFLGAFIAWLEYINETYRFNEFDLVMKKGVLDKRETSIPVRHIPDIKIERSLGCQILGLSRLVLKTIDMEEKGKQKMTEIDIYPIDKKVAEEIKNMLERKIGVQFVQLKEFATKNKDVL